MICAECKNKCGEGKSNPANKDPVFKALCDILCQVRKEFCEDREKGVDRHKGKNMGEVAEDKAKNSQKLKDALGKGRTAHVNKNRLVKYPNAPKRWGRSAVSQEVLDRQLKNMEQQFRKMVQKKVGEKALGKLTKAWTRFIPVVGWGMAAYDAYDIVTTGKQIYDDWDRIKTQFNGNDNYQVRPDVAVVDENGRLKDVYDFKLDNPESGFEDKWNPGQEEMYNKALADDGAGTNAKTVNAKDCNCDLPIGAKAMPGV